MYEFIRGYLKEISFDSVILEVSGIGYRLSTPLSLYGKVTPCPKEEIFFYTAFVVREEAHTLYGFLEKEERDLFLKLITISGVGPKTALNLIGHLSTSDLRLAVDEKDISTLSKVPGIGKKTAERLIVELKSKLNSIPTSKSSSSKPKPLQDAISALINLGYNESQAEKAVAKAKESLPSDADLATLLSTALKNR